MATKSDFIVKAGLKVSNSVTADSVFTTGNVGIGTSSPGAKLNVSGSFNAAAVGNYPVILGGGSFGGGIGFQDGTAVSGIYTQSTGTNLLFFTGQTSADTAASKVRMLIDGSGNVGIGTNSPANNAGYQTLTINGTSGGVAQIQVAGTNTFQIFSNATANYLNGQTALPMAFYTNATERMRIDSSGNLLVNRTTVSGLAGASGHIVLNDSIPTGSLAIGGFGSFLGRQASDGSTVLNAGQASIIFSRGSYGSTSESMRIDSSGNVGIGTNSPFFKLDISGGVLGTTAGNQVLLQRLTTTTNNGDNLEITKTRTSAGSSWESAGYRLQQKIDATWMGYIQLNGDNNNGGISFGTGMSTTSAVSISERMRINSSGYITAPYQPAFFVGGGQGTITTTVSSVLPFTSVNLDRTSSWNTSTYRFTAPVAGVYLFHMNIYTQNGTTKSSFCWRRNGTQLAVGAPNWTSGDNLISFRGDLTSFPDFTQASTIMINLALNDYIDIAVRAGASNVQWYPNHSWIMGYLIG